MVQFPEMSFLQDKYYNLATSFFMKDDSYCSKKTHSKNRIPFLKYVLFQAPVKML